MADPAFLRRRARIVVTDNPCLLACAYQTNPEIEAADLETHFGYPSLNIFVARSARYSQHGRIHEEDQARGIDDKMLGILNLFNILYLPVSIENGEQHSVAMVLHHARQIVDPSLSPAQDTEFDP